MSSPGGDGIVLTRADPSRTASLPLVPGDGTTGVIPGIVRAYQRLLQITFALVPMFAILYVATYQDQSLVYDDHAFHEMAIGVAILLSAFATWVTGVCYRSSGESFLAWLALGLLGFTLLYAPHGLFTRLSHDHLVIFVIFGPVSRLAMSTCFLVALLRFGAPPDPVEVRRRQTLWLRGTAIYVVIGVAAGAGALTMPALTLTLRPLIEYGALGVSLCAAAVMLVRRIRSPLMSIYLLSLAVFAQSSISFLLASTWNHQWWLAHALSAAGFFILSYGIVKAYFTTRSFSAVYSEEEMMEQLRREKARADGALAQLNHAHEALRRSEQEMRLILESADEGIFAVDTAGRCTLVNRSASRLLGFSAEAMLGANLHDLIHAKRPDGSPYPEAECALKLAMNSGSVHRTIGDVFWRSDATALHVALAGAPIVSEGAVRGMVVSFTDLTQRRSLESQLEEERRLGALGRLASTMAHEVNNVLMAIQAFSGILGRETSGSATAQRALTQVTNSVTRGKAVTEQIFQYTRPSPPVFTSIAVGPLIEQVAGEARSLLNDSTQLVVNQHEDLTIRGDREQVRTVLLQILRNASEAIEGDGRITIDVIRHTAADTFSFGIVEHAEELAHFIVTDDGHGMTPEVMGRLYEPLFTTKSSALGLGLPLAHRVVTEHGGSVFAESEIGRGTSFHVFLPLSKEPAARDDAKPSAGRSVLRSILLVEDDEAVAAGLTVLLELEGLTVTLSTRGSDAVASIARVEPDAVILDVGLPDIDGIRVYESIAERWPDLPVLFSTGHAEAAHLSRFLVKSNVGYLRKPYDVESVLRWLQTQGDLLTPA